MGSTRAARQAGTAHAATATVKSTAAAHASVDVSPGWTPTGAGVLRYRSLRQQLPVEHHLHAGGQGHLGQYFRGSGKLHAIGVLGGFLWMIALSFNVLASSVAGPAISYALGQGATLVAAIWGLFIWREFRAAPAGTTKYLVLMLVGYTCGLVMIGSATQ